MSHVSPLPPASRSDTTPKLRSCVVCRSRKVRCDKLAPCTNCRRANIACVAPSSFRPPRWARRLERAGNTAAPGSAEAMQQDDPGAGQVMDRLHNLESLVEELRGQLEQANSAVPGSVSSGASKGNSWGNSPADGDHQSGALPTTASNTGLPNQFGRLVLQDAGHSRYVSSGFWSRINDEIDGLNMDARGPLGDESDVSSEDEDSPGMPQSAHELDRTPSERHSFLFQLNLNPSHPDLHDLHPLPSQIPFLLSVYSENVQAFFHILHMPTVNKIVRDMRDSNGARLTPANEALLFSIYYAAVTSMEEDDIITNFGYTKSELSLKYRLGLEHALAKADFLNVSDIVLVQAFVIFLLLVRRHDSPRFVWMMTGLAIRMAQALGLHRDGSHFEHLTPYEVELRRRTWWAVCLLDMRASEDQGTELSTPSSSFDTKLPSNINDADIEPHRKEPPVERQPLTDMTFTIVTFEICNAQRRLMTPADKGGPSGPEEQSRLLNEIYESLDRRYLQHTTETNNITYWVVVNITRLIVAKMTLLIYLPVLFSSPNENLSDEIRNKLLVAAIEVAEYNHTINAEKACRHWRWVFQSHTHWHAIVYILIEICRRHWSPIVERAWVALHSSWLIPAHSKTDKDLRIWFPLRKLMTKARKHREAELERLRADTLSAAQLEIDDGNMPLPASSGPFPAGKGRDLFCAHWRELVVMPGAQTQRAPVSSAPPSMTMPPVPVYGASDPWAGSVFEQANAAHHGLSNTNIAPSPAIVGTMPSESIQGLSYNSPTTVQGDWTTGMPWLLPDMDPSVGAFTDVDANMDFDTDVNWYNWVESAKGMDFNTRTAENGLVALPTDGYGVVPNSTAVNSSTTAFNTSHSLMHTSILNSTPTRNKPTYTLANKTISELPSRNKEPAESKTAHVPLPTTLTTPRFNTSTSQNSTLTWVITDILNSTRDGKFGGAEYANKTNYTGLSLATLNTSDTLAIAEAFASDMFRLADRQNISDASWTSMVCSPTALQDARKKLSPIDLAALEQTCAVVASNKTNNTFNSFSNFTGIRPYNISGLSPSSSLRRLSKVAKFGLPQYGRGCMDDFGYFEMTAANLEESGVWEWYQAWTQEASSGPLGPRFATYGEVRLFGHVFLGDDDYDCGLEMGGCTRRPSCSSIMMQYLGNRDLARKVYFVMKLHNTVNLVLKTYYNTLLSSHVNVGGYIEPIITTCTQRISGESTKTCDFIRTSIKNVDDFVTEIGVAAMMSSSVLGSPTATQLVPGKILGVPAPVFLFSKALRIWRMWNAKALSGLLADNLCEGLGVIKTDDPASITLLRNGLLATSQTVRKSLSASTKQLNRGTFFDGGPSALSSMIASPIWANETGVVQILTDPYQMEELMTTAMKEGLMGASYRAAKCFMKCNSHPQANLFCEGFNDWEFSDAAREKYGDPGDGHAPRSSKAELESQMRICPRPDKVCQIECWSQEKRGFSMPMHGFSTVQSAPLNFNVQNAMAQLYEYYKARGNVDPYLDWGGNALGDLEGGAPRFWLPVCDSDAGYVHIADWGHQGNHLSDNVDRRAFPLSCGNYRSDETEEFIRAVGMDNVAPQTPFTLDPFYKVYAPKTLSAIIRAPLDSFLAFCALGIAYPQDAPPAAAITPFRFQREHSRFCEPIIAETQGMEWYLANEHFCEHSEAAQELFKVQLSTLAKHVTGMGGVVSHKELCARWISSGDQRSVNIETDNGGYVVGVDIESGSGGREVYVGVDKKEGNGKENEKGREKGNEKEKEAEGEEQEPRGKWKEKLKWKGDKDGKEKGKGKWKWKGDGEKEKGKWNWKGIAGSKGKRD
ncbi:hypothetical protein V492_06517 [Pseudogymnoascus sp. VKM F-4246]|nr:hypothetical protein V492_06517 [Pseudogymnoascus sp. VKM F-4246]